MAKFLSDTQTNIKKLSHQLIAFAIILIPALIIVPQPDPGSALVYTAFFFVLYREGLPSIYLIIGFMGAFLFVLTLALNPIIVSIITLIITVMIFLKNKKKET